MNSRDTELSFLQHLEELRIRLMYSVIAFAIGLTMGWFLAPYPLNWMTYPLERALTQNQSVLPTLSLIVEEDGALLLKDPMEIVALGNDPQIRFFRSGEEIPFHVINPKKQPVLHYLKPMDSFIVRFKAALVVGLTLVLPFLLLQVWKFIEPGLLPRERRLALPMILSGSILFPIGAGFAYLLLEVTLRFFAEFFMEGTVPFYDARAYLGFALTMMLAFGVVFEFPLVVVLATRTGLVSVQWLAERRKYIFLTLLVVAAIITPSGDPFTLMGLTLPLYLLFEGALIVCRLLDRAAAKEALEEEVEDQDP